jgi:mono/diheme cytochrome c family protein
VSQKRSKNPRASSRKAVRKGGPREAKRAKPVVVAESLAAQEPPEPRTERGVYSSIWLVTVFSLILYWAGLYVDSYGGHFNPLVFARGDMLADVEARVPKSEADELFNRGKQVYTTYCVACHQPNGRGVAGQFPPVAGSDWVNGVGPNRMIRIVLDGLQGPITVNGQQYNNVMLAWKAQLDDEDIAAVLTYVRTNEDWGNSGTAVSAAKVAEIRQATEGRSGYWTADELLAIPDAD